MYILIYLDIELGYKKIESHHRDTIFERKNKLSGIGRFSDLHL